MPKSVFAAYTLDKHLFILYAIAEIRSLGYQFVAAYHWDEEVRLAWAVEGKVLVFKDICRKSAQR